jgi:hypothetical protein
MPVIVKFPAPVAEMLEEEPSQTPLELVPVPHDVPLTVSGPDVVVTQEEFTRIPQAELVPQAAMPVIVKWPVPVSEMLEDEVRKTPMDMSPVPQEVPLTVSEPEFVVTQAPLT